MTEIDRRLLEALSVNSAEWWFVSSQWVSFEWFSHKSPPDNATWITAQRADLLVKAGYAEIINPGRVDRLLIITEAGRKALTTAQEGQQ